MLQISHDDEAGTLYWYFAELEEGQTAYVLEYPAALLLDQRGQVFGAQIALDDEVVLSQLEFALDALATWLDGEHGRLMVQIAVEEPARVIRLDATAILDLDEDDRILGIELAVPADLRTPAALARLEPLLITLDEAPQAGEGPVVFLEETEAAAGDQEAEEDRGVGSDEGGAVEEAAEQGPGARGQQTEDEVGQSDAQRPASNAQPPTLNTQLLPPVRSGFVALVGKPNVGKSTLLNALLGERVAIVSPRPQTTRVPMRGILTRPGAQIVFVDTPGIHKPSHRLGKLMVDLAERSLPGADVIGFMVDISQPPSQLDRRIAQQVRRARGVRLLILNKVDQRPRDTQGYLDDYRALGEWDEELAVSAKRQLGLGRLLEVIEARLPLGQPLYPDEQLTDRTEQQLAAEFVREQVLYATQDEVPHAVAVEVEEWEEKEHATYMRMTINVEREGQKAIVIGAGGALLKKVGSQARKRIEHLLGRPVYLDLWVKVRPNWRDDPSALGWLGYRAKDLN